MNELKRVLIVDDMHESILPLLREAGFDPVYLPIISRQEILEIIPEFHGLIIRSKTNVDRELLDKAVNLEFVARAGAGVDKLDENYLRQKEILIINAPEGNRDALAEHALGLLLGVLHRLNHSYEEVRSGVWDREGNRGIELKGKVVGIFGVGNMGKTFAQKLSALGCEVIGYDKYNESFGDEYVKSVSLETFLEETEILSIHVPLTEETRYLFDESYFARFKQLKIVLNTARGEVLRTADLLARLESETIYGAALDVLENEKPATYTQEEKDVIGKLTSHPNVIVTPHVGGWTFESYQRINEVLVDKLKEAFQK